MRRKPQDVPRKWKLSGLIDGYMTKETLAMFCCQFVDFVLVNRFQVPQFNDSQDFLRRIGEGEPESSVQGSSSFSRKRAGFHVRRLKATADRISNAYGACGEMSEALNGAFGAHMAGEITLKEVLLVIGPVASSPKEIYRLAVLPRTALLDDDCAETADHQLGVLKQRFLMHLSTSELFGHFFRDRLRPTESRICVRVEDGDVLDTQWTLLPPVRSGKRVKELVLDLKYSGGVDLELTRPLTRVFEVGVAPSESTDVHEQRWYCAPKAIKGVFLPPI